MLTNSSVYSTVRSFQIIYCYIHVDKYNKIYGRSQEEILGVVISGFPLILDAFLCSLGFYNRNGFIGGLNRIIVNHTVHRLAFKAV